MYDQSGFSAYTVNVTAVIQEHGWKVLTTSIPDGKVYIHFDTMQVTYNMPITQIESSIDASQSTKETYTSAENFLFPKFF